MSEQTPNNGDSLELLISRQWPAQMDLGALEERLRLIPQQFPQQLNHPSERQRPTVQAIWPWLFGGGLASATALTGFALGALGLMAPMAPGDWAALAYGTL